jgi:hypothetical protein
VTIAEIRNETLNGPAVECDGRRTANRASALATILRMSPDYGLSNGVGSIDRTSSRVRLLHCAVPSGTVEMVGFT